jgi:hypothetical protein
MSRKIIEELRVQFADADRDYLLLLVDEYDNMLQTLHKALKVTTLNPEIRTFLEAKDPMALRQIEHAIRISESTVDEF